MSSQRTGTNKEHSTMFGFVYSVFTFAPDGRIRIAVYNYPGAWHNSSIADHRVYQTIEEVYTNMCNGAKVVVDSAFALKYYRDSLLIKSLQRDPGNDNLLLLTMEFLFLVLLFAPRRPWHGSNIHQRLRYGGI